MPTLNLFTNVPVDAVVASDILKDATKAVSKIIGKPESYVMILLNGAVPIAFAGSEEPAAYGELTSIGGLGQSVNGKLSSAIADILQTKLYVDSSRFYIKFYDVQVGDVWQRTSPTCVLQRETGLLKGGLCPGGSAMLYSPASARPPPSTPLYPGPSPTTLLPAQPSS